MPHVAQEPVGWSDRATYFDPRAPHQIRIWYDVIACTCGWGAHARPADTDGDPYGWYLRYHPRDETTGELTMTRPDGTLFCVDCPDRRACADGRPCVEVKRQARDRAAGRRKTRRRAGRRAAR